MRKRVRSTRTENQEISKSYIVEYEGQYFAGWTFSKPDWATVSGFATWTKDRKKAEQIKIDTVVDRQSLMALTIGFSNTHLIEVNMEDYVTLVPKQKNQRKIWTSKKY